jgi:outer membrane protein assembly factor BamB
MMFRLTFFILIVSLTFVGCRKSQEPLANEKIIAAFIFKANDNIGVLTTDANGVIAGDTIRVTVDAASVSRLVAFATFSGQSISPSLDSSVNFMEPVAYTITAADGSIKQYTVIVNTASTLYAVGQTNNRYGSDGQDAYLYAFDAVTGKVRWSYFLNTHEATNPTIANGIVYIGVLGNLLALDATTGLLKWRANLSYPRGSANPQVANNMVYIAANGEYVSVYGFDAATGALKWRDNLAATTANNTLTAAGTNIVVDDNGRFGMHCLDANTGSLRWIFNGGKMLDNPVMVNGSVYIGSTAYKIVAIDVATGQKKWGIPSSNTSTNNGLGTSPTIHNGVLYNGGNTLNAYDAATGDLKWAFQPSNGLIVNPVGDNGVIYATNSGDIVYAINSDGTLKWQYGSINLTDTSTKRPSATVAHGIVYTGSAINNKLIALNAVTGQLVWSFEGIAPFTAGSCLVDSKGNVFHAATSGAQQ